jgi:Flp pilus assembly protein TadD
LLFAQASPEAIPLLQSAASASPSLKPNVDGLVSALNTALQDPSASGRLVACGRTLAAMSEWPLAQDTFLRATRTAPQDGLAWAWLGEAYQQTGSADPLPALEKAAALSPTSADVYGLVGLYWQRRQDWNKARVEFDSAAQLDPQAAVWQISLGEVYVQLGDLVKALAYYQAAVGLAPKDVQTWRALALFSIENNVDVDGTGRDAALQAYALDPKDPQNMDILGRSLMATAQWDAAETILKKAIAADPQNAAPVFHLGLLYLQTNQSDLARQTLQSAQKLDANGPIGAQAARVLARYFP